MWILVPYYICNHIQNKATCENVPGAYRCHCAPNFYGIHCMENANDCSAGSNKELCLGSGTAVVGVLRAVDPYYSMNVGLML